MGAQKVGQIELATWLELACTNAEDSPAFPREWFMAPFVVESVDQLHGLVGKEIGVSEWIVVKQERIRLFAEATEDRQWIHLDAERAKGEAPFGTTIGHGF